MKEFASLQKLAAGDQVAIVSPSAGLPQIFPQVYTLGLERIKDVFGLVPKEYPTTRVMGASLEDRARDVMDAFADPANKAVITSIGGEDQIKLIKYLDPEVFIKNPKPFLGYSDNTHIHNFLWNLGIPSFYGGAVMTQFGMHGSMDEITVESIKNALFETGWKELAVSAEYNDIDLDWGKPELLEQKRVYEPNDGLVWDGSGTVEGVLWGGCIESLVFQCTVAKYLPRAEDLDGVILCIETAEDIPDPWLVECVLSGFGERGWFNRFGAVLVGRPKAWEFGKQKSTQEKAGYRKQQRETVLAAVRGYNATIPVIQNLDFGHSDPQVLLPFGRRARIDSQAKKILLEY